MYVTVNGIKKNYKSINFTHFREGLINGTKCQTCRTGFIPQINDIAHEIVAITFRELPEDLGEKKAKDFPKELLFLVPIERIYPKRLYEISIEEANRDGFVNIEDFVNGLTEINNIKFKEHWSFLIQWDPGKRIFVKEENKIQTIDKFLDLEENGEGSEE